MLIRTYKVICPSCKGMGFIEDPSPVSTSVTITCKACEGSGLINVTETDFDNYIETISDCRGNTIHWELT